ncbi:hypothetical protein ACWF0M_04520 [Kribbella sp. NPDC055110]
MMPPLLKEYQHAVTSGDALAIAQAAFAAALRAESTRQAQLFAAVSLAAAERAPSATLDDVTSPRASIGGISIPDYFHDGVVRRRLAHLLPTNQADGPRAS